MEMITKTDDIVSQAVEMIIQLNSMFAFSSAPATLHPKEIINYQPRTVWNVFTFWESLISSS